MKVELHLHTRRYSACALAGPEEILAAAVRHGYQAVFLTEHDAVWPADDLAELAAAFPALRVFGGVELTVDWDSMSHLLVLGTCDPAYVRLASRPEDVLARARDEGHLTVLAHPLRYSGDVPLLRRGLRPDAIEHRTPNQASPELARQAAALAARYGLRLVNAGDVHAADSLDRFWIETHRPVAAAGDIRPIVLAGAYDRHTGPGE